VSPFWAKQKHTVAATDIGMLCWRVFLIYTTHGQYILVCVYTYRYTYIHIYTFKFSPPPFSRENINLKMQISSVKLVVFIGVYCMAVSAMLPFTNATTVTVQDTAAAPGPTSAATNPVMIAAARRQCQHGASNWETWMNRPLWNNAMAAGDLVLDEWRKLCPSPKTPKSLHPDETIRGAALLQVTARLTATPKTELRRSAKNMRYLNTQLRTIVSATQEQSECLKQNYQLLDGAVKDAAKALNDIAASEGHDTPEQHQISLVEMSASQDPETQELMHGVGIANEFKRRVVDSCRAVFKQAAFADSRDEHFAKYEHALKCRQKFDRVAHSLKNWTSGCNRFKLATFLQKSKTFDDLLSDVQQVVQKH
jgi:hypothetical protein